MHLVSPGGCESKREQVLQSTVNIYVKFFLTFPVFAMMQLKNDKSVSNKKNTNPQANTSCDMTLLRVTFVYLESTLDAVTSRRRVVWTINGK